ncbi:MAG: hypothetical protein NUV53_00740 [Patescibacteria group bacterium]|nr:hypothetical protein [Patescibacteria group bacterium]
MKRLWNWMKRAVGDTGSIVIKFGSEILTSFLGHEIGERVGGGTHETHTHTQRAATIAGKILREMTPKVKRETVRDALDYIECERTGSEIKKLLARANFSVDANGHPKARGIYIHNKTPYFENKLAKFIEEVATVSGKEAVLALDDMIRFDPSEDAFFAEYELWNNDGFLQPARYYWSQLMKLKPKIETTCDRLTTGIRAVADEISTWKGAKR